ncbi:MAG: AmmeMemoRadiSam system protein B [Thermodesulfobacteriota bacterium]
MIRKAVVAGQFYPGGKAALAAEVRSLLGADRAKEEATAAVCPHAGYMYSGEVAAAVYARLNVPKQVVILCPNHTGRGHPSAVMSEGAWETPLGQVPINTPLASRIKEGASLLEDDALAHLGEHSLEVQLPFLQQVRPDVEMVPLCLSPMNYFTCQELGSALARAISSWKDRVLLLASTDMTHYESQEAARRKDNLAIEKILTLDPAGLHRTVVSQSISMCGYVPTTVVLAAAKELGARQAELVLYRTSGDVTGDFDQVVGYAGIIIK